MSIISDALNVLFPGKCVVCGRQAVKTDELPYDFPRNSYICNRCLSMIVPQPSDRRWLLCLSEPYSGDKYSDLPLFMPFTYNEILSRIIKSIKFAGRREMGTMLGVMLAEMLKEEGLTNEMFDMVIPVPLSSQRQKERGYNQAELLGLEISRKLDIKCCSDVIYRSRNTNRQAKISDSVARSLNVTGAFKLSEEWSVQGLRILLVDDVVTSGNTMHEAASVLLDGGAEKVLCCAVCGNRNAKNAEPF